MTDEPTITIWCDDPSHPARRPRVFVAAYTRYSGSDEDGQRVPMGWALDPQRRRNPRTTPPRVEWQSEKPTETRAAQFSAKHNPECRWCKKPLDIRLGKFDAYLDALRAVGRADVTMSELRALINASGKRRP